MIPARSQQGHLWLLADLCVCQEKCTQVCHNFLSELSVQVRTHGNSLHSWMHCALPNAKHCSSFAMLWMQLTSLSRLEVKFLLHPVWQFLWVSKVLTVQNLCLNQFCFTEQWQVILDLVPQAQSQHGWRQRHNLELTKRSNNPGSRPGQDFFMFAPKHPVMYYSLLVSYNNLLNLEDVGGQYVPTTTGPASFHAALHKTTKMNNLDRRWPWGIYKIPNSINNRSFYLTTGRNYTGERVVFDEEVKSKFYKATDAIDYERHANRNKKYRTGKTCYDMIYGSTMMQREQR